MNESVKGPGDADAKGARLSAESTPSQYSEGLPQEDSFATDIRDPTEAEALRALEVEHARLRVVRANDRQLGELRMHPSEHLPDDPFDEEIKHDTLYTSGRSGLSYSVAELNQDQIGTEKHERPLVLLIGLLGNIQKGEGSDFAHELALHNPGRRIIAIQREGMGNSSKPDKDWLENLSVAKLGEGRLDVLDQMGVNEFDVVGYSFGAVAAAGLAAEAGDRAHTVVTLGMPGFEAMDRKSRLKIAWERFKDVRKDPARVAGEIFSRLHRRAEAADNPAAESASRAKGERAAHIRTTVGLGRFGSRTDEVRDALTKLDPSTHWTDIVGNTDPSTKWQQHVAAARERNGQQRNSDVTLLTDRAHAHLDMSTAHALMAEVTARALERGDSREG